MLRLSDYEFKLDLYHNNYATAQQIAIGLKAAQAAGDQKKIDFFEGLAIRVAGEEAKFFKDGVEAADGDATKFFKDVLKTYPDLKDSAPFKLRLEEVGLTIKELGLDDVKSAARAHMPKLGIAQSAGILTSAMADYKEASSYIDQPGFANISQENKNEYALVYAAAKLLQSASYGLSPDLGYSIFRDWANKVQLPEKDLIKLDPTTVTQNNIKQGFPAGGFVNPLQDLEI